MDELAQHELFEATAGLGNWHEVGGKAQYLANREECLSCLRDLQIALQHDGLDTGCVCRLKLGDWKVLSNHMVPLFTSYREDVDISSSALKLMVMLTTWVSGISGSEKFQHLHHLQDYKEAFAKKDVFIILMGLLVETMEEDDEAEARPNRQEVFKSVLTLLCNLVSVPDPSPGDAGFTPLRRNLQMTYIRHFHDEGVLDFFLLFAEGVAAEKGGNEEQQAWYLADIIYHICTHVDPVDLMQNRKEKNKRSLADLLERDHADSKLHAPQSSRHSRFGTAMQRATADGRISISASVVETKSISKGSLLQRKEYRNADSDKKYNVFHDPFFVDLEEGAVRDHNQLNPHVKGSLQDGKNHPDAVIEGLRKFFEEFIQTSFSTLVSIMRGSCSPKADGTMVGTQFNKAHLMNFVSWFLEFHRHHYGSEVAKAKKSKEQLPVVDIASIQGAIDLDMIQFTTARLREYGKQANIHASQLVVSLRCLSQQIKTIGVVTESSDSDTRDCGDILVQNIIKDDVMSNLSWIMKNFSTSSHDPRVLSYTVEVFHTMLRLMTKVSERRGRDIEFQVDRVRGRGTVRAATNSEKEIAGLADARVVENLFHLLEKYRRHTAQLHSMLVKLIYQVIRAQPTNIVIFFELSYFMRIFRMMQDPQLSGSKNNKRYEELVSLLRFILRQFFKCAEVNGCVFAELLFRKVQDNPKEALLESHASEFAAILDNYEDESYKRILDRMGAGETLGAMRLKQRAILKGQLPWMEEEDKVLRERYPMYADHPLCAELLAAELPEESKRTALQVRRRLVELELVVARGAGRSGEATAGEEDEDERPAKKPKASDVNLEENTSAAGAASPQGAATQDAAEMLEEDLERLLDAAYDSLPTNNAAPSEPHPNTHGATGMPTNNAATSEPHPNTHGATGITESMDLEAELEALLEEDNVGATKSVPSQSSSELPGASRSSPTGPVPQPRGHGAASQPRLSQHGPTQAGSDSLEMELERLMDEGPSAVSASQRAPASSSHIGTSAASQPCQSQANASQQIPDSLELDLERMMDETLQTASRPTAGSEPASQLQPPPSGPDSLEADLERLMDESQP
eukprot:TRINITY_DN19415_c0_g3_i1.p1 TRINITY_DN19415_c0_g3~~TRINITY_DN19415_c0_g3_i1.p1  ORF type:complete len:1085 (-),score=189.66 TRINITY_DN19415_c0_g3_i1:88-3342(-)